MKSSLLKYSAAILLLPSHAWAQNIIYGNYWSTDFDGPINSGDWEFHSGLFVDTSNGVTGGTQTFITPSPLHAYVANAVTGGMQTFYGGGDGPSYARAIATQSLSGAHITLYDDCYVNLEAEDAMGAGASIVFKPGATNIYSSVNSKLKLNGHDVTIGSIDSTGGAGTITNATGDAAMFTVSSGQYSGQITDGGGGALSLTKTGAGTLTLSGTSSYSGGTTINGGKIVASGGSLGSGNVTIGAGTMLQATGAISGMIDVSGGLENGVGAIGTLSTGAQTWHDGGSYSFRMSDPTAAAGTGYDALAIAGGLTVASSLADAFVVNMNTEGRLDHFVSSSNYTWTVAATSGITGLDPGDLALDLSGFSNGYNGTFNIGASGNNLVINYTGAADTMLSGSTSTTGPITTGSNMADAYFTIDTTNGITGGDTFLTSAMVTESNGITGGWQKFSSDYPDATILSATQAISGGTQEFTGDVIIVAKSAISGGVQTFQNSNISLGHYFNGSFPDGSIHGGEQSFYGNSLIMTSVSTSGITGGTQRFYDTTGVNANISGGAQDFYDTTKFGESSGVITGGTQHFHNNSKLFALSSGKVSGASLIFDVGSIVYADGSGVINNSSLTFNGGILFNYTTGVITNSSILVKNGSSINTSVLGTGNSLSFDNGGSVSSGGNRTVLGLQSVTPGAGALHMDSTSTLTVEIGGTSTNTFSGTINGVAPLNSSVVSLAKTGTGSLVLSGTNTYTGMTTVSAGSLYNNGSLASPITVKSGATLGGSGDFLALATVEAGGTIAPGNSPDTITFTSGLTLDLGSMLNFELGTISDLIVVSGGTLTGPSLGNITLNISDSGGFTAGTYTLFNNTGATLNNFDLSDFTLGATVPGYDYSLNTSGSLLQLMVTATIPEPTTTSLLGLGVLSLCTRRKRRSTLGL